MFFLPRLLGNVLSDKVDDSTIIRNSTILGGRGMSNVPQQNSNAVTYKTALKTFSENSEYISSRTYKQDFSTMQNIRMQ